MRGTVLAYDARTATGTISGDDGKRYTFKGTDTEANLSDVGPGAVVDFQIEDGRAISVFPLKPARSTREKSKIAAGLLAIFLGAFGIHKFYLGMNTAGIIMLLVTLLGWILLFIPNFVIGIIALVEGVIYLTKSDDDFYETYEVGKKAWF